jgi:hypothetical protein
MTYTGIIETIGGNMYVERTQFEILLRDLNLFLVNPYAAGTATRIVKITVARVMVIELRNNPEKATELAQSTHVDDLPPVHTST